MYALLQHVRHTVDTSIELEQVLAVQSVTMEASPYRSNELGILYTEMNCLFRARFLPTRVSARASSVYFALCERE